MIKSYQFKLGDRILTDDSKEKISHIRVGPIQTKDNKPHVLIIRSTINPDISVRSVATIKDHLSDSISMNNHGENQPLELDHHRQ